MTGGGRNSCGRRRQEYRRLDVTQEDGWTALVADVEAKYGRIDILCNIAGIANGIDATTGTRTGMALPGLSLDSWNQVMAVNAAGVFGEPRRCILR